MKKTIFTTLLTISFVSVLFLTGCGQKTTQPDTDTVPNTVQNTEQSESKGDTSIQEKFWQAVAKGSLDDVKTLIEQGADTKTPYKNDGWTPLPPPSKIIIPENHWTPLYFAAAHNSNVDVLKYLVEKGANVNIKTDSGETPLHVAASTNSNVDVLKYLIEKGADVNAKDMMGWTPLHFAAAHNSNVDILKYLVEKGADINAKNKYNDETPLTWAVRRGNSNVDVLKYLVEKGADVNTKDIAGWTLLHFAASNNSNVDVLKYLVEKGADVNAKSNEGKTPLFIAAISGNLGFIKYFVAQGLIANVKDNYGKTPLFNAASSGNLELVKYFVAQGLDVNEKSNDGETPLFNAVRSSKSKYGLVWTGHESPLPNLNNLNIVKYLVNAVGADVNVKNNSAETPLDVVPDDAEEVKKFLREKGCKSWKD
ncbi:MAG: ankyrin repeat domain-containing protein [Planctomycetaceae bacterium]|jgi:ankyrin repeat protein|nr:ankyrin repeat domain-containing protein [Planctomycetaceae bacterium]